MVYQHKAAVVILGWNGLKFLEQFLGSVVTNSAGEGIVIVYADNASSDGSVAFVSDNFPEVQIIETGDNRGFAGGYNFALDRINAEYFVLLNQDVEVSANWLQPLIKTLDSDSSIAAAQPKLLSYYERYNFEYAGASGGYVDWLGFAFCRGRIFDVIEKDEGQYNEPADIFWASGAALFIRSAVYLEAGGLDEDFFAHQEEIDLCWRVLNLGFRIVVIPQSVVFHVGGGSLPQGNPRKTYLNFRNNLFLLLKNLPASQLWWKLPYRILLDIIAAYYSVIKNGHLSDFLAIAKAHYHFLSDASKMMNKRKPVKEQKAVLFPKSIVWHHFIKGKKRYNEL